MKCIKVKVVNKCRLRDKKDRTIRTNEADGTEIAIQDGAVVELSEYAYNNLVDAKETLYRHVKKDPNKDMTQEPAELVATDYSTIDVTPMGDWFEKPDKYPKKEIEKSDETAAKDRMAKARAAKAAKAKLAGATA